MDTIRTYAIQIARLCKRYKVRKLYAFGSVLTEEFRHDSDIDLIVDFSSISAEDYTDNYFDFKFALQSLLNRKVDLLEQKAIKNPYFRQAIDEKKQLIYGN